MFLKSISLILMIGSCTLACGRDSGYILQPPKGWDCISDPQQLPQKIKVIFVGSGHGNNSFTPSVNLACETTNLSLKEYVAQAKAYHEGRPGTRCNVLGIIQTHAGAVHMLQIDRPSQWGEIRFIQAMHIVGADAYVITATCLKNDFSALSSQIFKTIQSFSINSDPKHCQ